MNGRPLYEQILGEAYARLPAAVQLFHSLSGHRVLHGWVQIEAPQGKLATALAACLGTPLRAGCGPLRFELTADPAVETWQRHFPMRTMRSQLRRAATLIEESLGAARLSFRLHANEERLSMQLVRLRFLGLPCPRWLLPRIVAEERGAADRIHFLIIAELPFVGRVASYHGYLELGMKESA